MMVVNAIGVSAMVVTVACGGGRTPYPLGMDLLETNIPNRTEVISKLPACLKGTSHGGAFTVQFFHLTILAFPFPTKLRFRGV